MLTGTPRDLLRLRNALTLLDEFIDEDTDYWGEADADDIEERNQLNELIETFQVVPQSHPDNYEGDDERAENGLLPIPGEGG